VLTLNRKVHECMPRAAGSPTLNGQLNVRAILDRARAIDDAQSAGKPANHKRNATKHFEQPLATVNNDFRWLWHEIVRTRTK